MNFGLFVQGPLVDNLLAISCDYIDFPTRTTIQAFSLSSGIASSPVRMGPVVLYQSLSLQPRASLRGEICFRRELRNLRA